MAKLPEEQQPEENPSGKSDDPEAEKLKVQTDGKQVEQMEKESEEPQAGQSVKLPDGEITEQPQSEKHPEAKHVKIETPSEESYAEQPVGELAEQPEEQSEGELAEQPEEQQSEEKILEQPLTGHPRKLHGKPFKKKRIAELDPQQIEEIAFNLTKDPSSVYDCPCHCDTWRFFHCIIIFVIPSAFLAVVVLFMWLYYDSIINVFQKYEIY